MKNTLRTVAAIVVLALGIVAVVTYVKLNRDKREARQLIVDAEGLLQDENAIALCDFLVTHSKFVRPAGDCSESRCAYVANLRNSSLAFFHLAPPGEFYISVLVQKSKVQEVYVSVKTVISGRLYSATLQDVSAGASRRGIKTLSSDAVVNTSGKLITSALELGPGATASERTAAFKMNVNCIFELNGCSDPSQITGEWPKPQ